MVRTLSIERRSCGNYFFTGREKIFVKKNIRFFIRSKIWLQQCLICQPIPVQIHTCTFTGIRNLTQTRVNTRLRARSNRFLPSPFEIVSRVTFVSYFRQVNRKRRDAFLPLGALDCASLLVNYRPHRLFVHSTEFPARTVKNETIIAIFFRPPLSSSPLPATTFRMKIREHANDEIRRPFEPEFADVRSSGEHPFVPGC